MQNKTSNDTRPTLCVINYNGANVLPDALEAACRLTDRFGEMLVIDNGSTDGSVETVERHFSPFRVVRLGANLGAGGARNAGLRKAASDLILFIDNDVALTAACVDELVGAMESTRGRRWPRQPSSMHTGATPSSTTVRNVISSEYRPCSTKIAVSRNSIQRCARWARS